MIIDKCIAPAEIEEGDLLAYMNNEASAVIKQHMTNCAFCQEELSQLGHQMQTLTETLFRLECPEPWLLQEYRMAFLDDTQHRQVETHVRRCDHCLQEMRLYDTALAMLPAAAKRAATPTPSWLEQAEALGKRILEAILLPQAAPTAVSLRGQGPTQHMYQAGEYQIMVTKTPTITDKEQWQLQGKLLHTIDPLADMSGQVGLAPGNQISQKIEMDEFGYFAFDEILAGEYILYIDLGDAFIPIRQIQVP